MRDQPTLPGAICDGWGDDADTRPTPEQTWLRWPPAELLICRVTSSRPVRYRGHWHSPSRTMRPCPGDLCAICSPTQAARWRYVLAVQLADGTQRAWEFGDAVAQQVRELPPVPDAAPQRAAPLLSPGATELTARALRLASQASGGGPARRGGQASPSVAVAGLRLVLARAGARYNGAVQVQIDPDPDDWGPVPAPMDVAGALAESWARAALKERKAK